MPAFIRSLPAPPLRVLFPPSKSLPSKTWSLKHDVVAAPPEEGVVTAVTAQESLPSAAVQEVVAVAAFEEVVADFPEQIVGGQLLGLAGKDDVAAVAAFQPVRFVTAMEAIIAPLLSMTSSLPLPLILSSWSVRRWCRFRACR